MRKRRTVLAIGLCGIVMMLVGLVVRGAAVLPQRNELSDQVRSSAKLKHVRVVISAVGGPLERPAQTDMTQRQREAPPVDNGNQL